jgi:hypothetical protein
MTITYPNGRAIHGILLSKNDGCIRVAVKGCDDVVEFTAENGLWFSEDGEPVLLEFAWERHVRNGIVSEADCICSKGLQSLILQLLRSDSEDNYEHALPKVLSMGASFY